MKIKILFVIYYNKVQWIELDRLARALPEKDFDFATLYISQAGGYIPEIKKLRTLYPVNPLRIWSIAQKILDKLPFLKRFSFVLRHAHTFIGIQRRCLKTEKPDVLILCEENPGTTHFTTRMAHRMGIKVVAVPYTLCGPHGTANFFYNAEEHQLSGKLARFVAFFFPKWLFEYKGKKIFYHKPLDILCYELLGATPQRPWYTGSSWVDVMAVESQAMKDYYIRQKVAPERIRVLGSAALHELMQKRNHRAAIREDLASRYGLDAGKPIFFCPLPPEVRDLSAATFKTNEEILRNLTAPLRSMKNGQVIFGLHPREADRQSPLLDELALYRGKLTDCLAAMDGFIAPISATIRWAVALGLPVINFDIFNTQYNDFISVSSVKTIFSMQEYIEAVRQLDDPVLLKKWREDAEGNCRYWTMPEGDFGKNFGSFLKDLVAAPKKSGHA